MKAALKSWGKSLSVVLLMITAAYVCGYFFAHGVTAAGGLVKIHIEQLSCEGST